MRNGVSEQGKRREGGREGGRDVPVIRALREPSEGDLVLVVATPQGNARVGLETPDLREGGREGGLEKGREGVRE